MGNHLYDALLGSADPDSVAARLPDGRAWRYGDIHAGAGRYATALHALGLQPGDRLAMQAPKSIDAILLYLGCLRAGVVFLPLNTAYTASEVDYFLDDSGARLLVTDVDREAPLRPVADRRGAIIETLGVTTPEGFNAGSLAKRAAAQCAELSPVSRAPQDLAAILYTSGTTGRSKGAMLTHDNLLSNARTLVRLWQFSNSDVLLHALPVFHTHGLFVAVHTVLLAGASMLFLPAFSVDGLIEHLPGCTVLMGVPTFYTRLLADPRFDRERVRGVRLFISGSAPLLAQTHVEFERRTGHRILERYGMTEASMITSNPCDGERRAGTVGFPLPGVSLRVSDPESGRPLEPGEVGSIEISGPNVFAGYWRMAEKTASEFRADGWFVTGDLGQFDQDGYLSIVGRSRDLIISGGLNIYPREVEQAVDQIEGVTESAVIGVPHPDLGEAVVALVVADGGATLDDSAVIDALAGKLARFKQPRAVVFVDRLPRNAMGKVQKNRLREQFGNRFA